MEKIVGNIVSKTTQKVYLVKWNSDEHTSWISREPNMWEMVCTKIYSEQDAIVCAQKFIDSQYETY